MAAKRNTGPAAEGASNPTEPRLIELESIETLFDRRVRVRDAKHRFYWDGTWIRIVESGRSGAPRTKRLSPVGVIMGAEVES
jgi:hypothetical protein